MGTHKATYVKLDQVDQLTRRGMSLTLACAEVGLDPQTWYRHTPRTSDDHVADDVLAIVQAIRKQVIA